jgi:hypothetical protein
MFILGSNYFFIIHTSLHGATTQKTAIFVVTAMETSSHIQFSNLWACLLMNFKPELAILSKI